MEVAQTQNLKEIIRSFLSQLDFNVKENLTVEGSFSIDMVATRGGLTLIVDFEDFLDFNSVAKLKTLGSLLEHRYSPISLKKMVLTTSQDISENISDFAKNNSIVIVSVKPEEDKIRRAVEKIDFLRPMFQEEVNVLKIVEDELKETGDESCLELLNRVRDWYQKGGSSLVRRRIMAEIDRIAERGG